ncbi:Glucose-6-phosphate/phosphate and phosphoenolpyruvate/phosphate antiporter [Klebsormidium nitens]|uniref:Glucose-6-phosphate/phosphate and phosphoenolpyruvate/phosphate antiporter n=1 Tax=Klebsormidium nitens TaxID=105231 RepID=A0A1Y1HYG1_KLENI|nr:Glucose-6-phosphate/phosphate and phosphoenolpyruvate/phosphate antiporter [Klebsormidium nitens]|eukprot:GAQ81566.1 Glucose-6-phosphate/phosphate and phosphoenolpyruvate/phosphate antiporter [Klebsormidium nitens]
MEKRKLLSDVGVWALNIGSSVGIIFANKQVLSVFDFKFATSLTAMHFLVTSLAGALGKASGGVMSSGKTVPFWDILLFTVMANCSIVGMNVSLMLNSVGFYQISKLSMIPVSCVFEYLIHGKTFSAEVKASIAVVLLGVGVVTVTDLNVNFAGLLTAVIAVVSTSLQQIFIGSLQKKHGVTSFELLGKVAPIQAVTLTVMGPFVDYFLTSRRVIDYPFSVPALMFIGLSCVLAVFCNISQFMCIGRFSAVTFQVVGHIKTVLILFLGWAVFHQAMSLKNVGGIVLAIAGMLGYSWALEYGGKSKLQPESVIRAAATNAIKRVINAGDAKEDGETSPMLLQRVNSGELRMVDDSKV